MAEPCCFLYPKAVGSLCRYRVSLTCAAFRRHYGCNYDTHSRDELPGFSGTFMSGAPVTKARVVPARREEVLISQALKLAFVDLCRLIYHGRGFIKPRTLRWLQVKKERRTNWSPLIYLLVVPRLHQSKVRRKEWGSTKDKIRTPNGAEVLFVHFAVHSTKERRKYFSILLESAC